MNLSEYETEIATLRAAVRRLVEHRDSVTLSDAQITIEYKEKTVYPGEEGVTFNIDTSEADYMNNAAVCVINLEKELKATLYVKSQNLNSEDPESNLLILAIGKAVWPNDIIKIDRNLRDRLFWGKSAEITNVGKKAIVVKYFVGYPEIKLLK